MPLLPTVAISMSSEGPRTTAQKLICEARRHLDALPLRLYPGRLQGVFSPAVLPGRLSARVRAPWTVTAEFLRKSGAKRLFVHLVNYAANRVPAGVAVVLAGGAGRTARLYVPDSGIDGRELKAAKGQGGAGEFRLPAFQRYALLVV